MSDNIVEVGFLLDNDLDYYEDKFQKLGIEKIFSCETYDRYWTNKNFDELHILSENQIKRLCVRVRACTPFDEIHFYGLDEEYHIDNLDIFSKNKGESINKQLIDKNEIKKVIEDLENNGWYKIFDTFKRDYHYREPTSNLVIQLQEIDNIGLVLYFDNPEIYEIEEELQRKMLIDELNQVFDFNFQYEELGVDKLRTLLTGQTCWSLNQNK